MNILQINSIDNRGGAAKSTSRLAAELRRRGHKSSLLVGHRVGGVPQTEEITYSKKARNFNHRFHLHGAFLPTAQEVSNHAFFNSAEIIHYHNLHLEPEGYFNIRDLATLSRQKPSIWTLRDAWLVHGHGKTPQYDVFFQRLAWYNYLKGWSVHRSEVVLVSPSKWLANLVRQYYPEKRVEVIPNGVDASIFKPINKRSARAALGLTKDKPLVLFVANEGEDNPPKGAKFIEEARAALNKEVDFVSVGSSRLGTYITDERQMAKYYCAADVFLLPSMAENFPLAIIEAMACGTPAVAFDTGGVREAINHLENGYVARYADGDDLLVGIQKVLSASDEMGKKAVKRAREDFPLSKMTDSYIKLYSSII